MTLLGQGGKSVSGTAVEHTDLPSKTETNVPRYLRGNSKMFVILAVLNGVLLLMFSWQAGVVADQRTLIHEMTRVPACMGAPAHVHRSIVTTEN